MFHAQAVSERNNRGSGASVYPRRGRFERAPISHRGRRTFSPGEKLMSHENPPDTCPFCETCRVYRNGRCWECAQSARELRGDEQRERETIERLRDRATCED